MFSHVTLGVKDLDRAIAFYMPLMTELGLMLKSSTGNWAGWKYPGAERPLFIISYPYDGGAAEPGNGPMAALLASSRAVVRTCYARAMENGGMSEGKPGLRPHYHPNYYGAYFRDLDGNKLCVCCHQAYEGGELD